MDENGNDQHIENWNDWQDENGILHSPLVSHSVIPPAYIVFDGKHNGCHKDCCIADGHLTNTSVDTASSGVDCCDTFILSAQTCMLFLNGIDTYTGRDPFLDYGEYYWTYNASSYNACVF